MLVKEVDLKKFIAYMHLVPTNSLISFEAAFTVNVPVPCSNSLLFLEPWIYIFDSFWKIISALKKCCLILLLFNSKLARAFQFP